MDYALIGCGRIAVNHIKAAVAQGLRLAAVCDLEPDKMLHLLAGQGLEGDESIGRYTDYRRMLKERRPQLVAIATPSGSHADIALHCIGEGVAVIIEKPIALSMTDADAIVELAQERGVPVCACHQNRFNLAVQELRRAVEDRRLGRMSHASVHVRWNRGREYYTQAPWRGSWEQDGGALMNQCIHGIDLLRWMMDGQVSRVYGVTRRRQHQYLEAEDVGLAVVEFADGAIATVEGTTNTYPRNLEETLYLFGESGTVKLGGKSVNNIEVWEFARQIGEDSHSRILQEEAGNVYGNGHQSLYADMIEAVADGRAPYVDARAGRDALELVLAIYKSQKTGQPVELPLGDFSTLDMMGEF